MLRASIPTVDLLKSKIGDTIWVDKTAADVFSVITETDLQITYKASYGYYIITNVYPSKKHYGDLDGIYISTKTITFHHISWDPSKDKGLIIDINQDGQVLVPLFGPIKLDFYQAFTTVKELCKVNDERFDCIVCGRKLNMVLHTVRICKICESQLI